MTFDLADSQGVLPSQWLRKALGSGIIRSPVYAFDDSQIQPASLDLRLGDWAYRLRCSFLPGQSTVEAALPRFDMGRVDLRDGAVLERDRPYLIPLSESLELPEGLVGRANPKSSTGRLDIFTRVITDRSAFFDDIPRCYRGNLYLEVVSRSFTIKVKRGLSLNQLRLMSRPRPVPDDELRSIHSHDPMLSIGGEPLSAESLPLNGGLFLSIALGNNGSRQHVGWRAKKNSHLLDLTSAGSHDPHEFWDRVDSEPEGGIVLEPEEFYLLLSQEKVTVPPNLAAEMIAYDPTSGELRTHYAGFFDPGFGHSVDAQGGSHAALEVRAHDVPFMIQNGQRICKLSFERLVEQPDRLYGSAQSHYQFQARALSKHFREASGEGARDQDDLGRTTSTGTRSDERTDDLTLPLFDMTDG